MKAKSGRFVSRKRSFHSAKLSKLAKLGWGRLREDSSPATVSSTPAAVDHSAYCCQDDEDGTSVPSVATEVEVETEPSWAEGRRIVELGVLAQNLQHCMYCQMPLQLIHCESETQYGLGSVLHIRCYNSSCMMTNKIPTGKLHRQGLLMSTQSSLLVSTLYWYQDFYSKFGSTPCLTLAELLQ